MDVNQMFFAIRNKEEIEKMVMGEKRQGKIK